MLPNPARTLAEPSTETGAEPVEPVSIETVRGFDSSTPVQQPFTEPSPAGVEPTKAVEPNLLPKQIDLEEYLAALPSREPARAETAPPPDIVFEEVDP